MNVDVAWAVVTRACLNEVGMLAVVKYVLIRWVRAGSSVGEISFSTWEGIGQRMSGTENFGDLVLW